MNRRYLGFVLLLWFQGVLHGQSAMTPCRAPSLTGGYFVPENQIYAHETILTYMCDNGLKPAVEGWWGASTCQNGSWSPIPQCINKTACFPIIIPNAKYTENENGWYEDGHKIRITCDERYEYKERDATAKCVNGTWISVPACEKSEDACGEPPKIPHAVIIDQGYQDLFAANTELQYECEDGYTAEGAGNQKAIYCIKGAWTEGPTCSKVTGSGAGHGGSTAGETGGGHSTSPGSGSQPTGGVGNCGNPPEVPNGEVVDTYTQSVRYQCNIFYKLQGQERVWCNRDGMWSKPPTCKATFCYMNPLDYPELRPVGDEYLKHGETLRFECVEPGLVMDHFSEVTCTDGRMSISGCCNKFELYWNTCKGHLTKRTNPLRLDLGLIHD